MLWEEQLAQHRAEILSWSDIVESEIFIANFKEMRYGGRSIENIMDDQGWIGHMKREGVASVWRVTIRGVTF